MAVHFTTKVFMSAVVFSTLGLASGVKPLRAQSVSPITTTFHCITLGQGYATIARRGAKQTPPMITWTKTTGGGYTPQKRCNIVSERFTKAVAANGGKLGNLKLKVGTLNRNPILCYVRSKAESCDANNLILTLNSSDRGKEANLIADIKYFSINGKGRPLTRNILPPIIPGEELPLGSGIDKSLATGAETTPASPARPSVQPSRPAPSGVSPSAPAPDLSI